MASETNRLASWKLGPRRFGHGRPERGMTLVELMVAMAISLFMVSALVVLYVSNSAARSELDRSSRQIENGRFAIEVLREDIALAGYYGEVSPRDIALANYGEANPCTTVAANMGWSTTATPAPARAPTPVQGAASGAGGTIIPAAWGCATLNQKADTGYLVVRRLQPDPIAATAALANTQYVQSGGCPSGAVPFVLAAGPGATNFTLQAADCAAVSPVRAYVSRLYYVASCGICSPNDGVPTLKMRELQGSTIVERIISDGIEDLQFEFGRDVDQDGVVDDYLAAAAAADWANVVAIRIRLISRGVSSSPGYTDDKTYDRGSLFAAYTPSGSDAKFKRRAYTALVQLPNIAGPRETP